MVDHVSKEKRSEIMRLVKSKNTKPELLVRSATHRLGLRFRLHDPRLPGKPDIVLPRWKVVIFVNGCYWHRHRSCRKATLPKSNIEQWENKFRANVARDASNYKLLKEAGWRVIIIWQCQIRDLDTAKKLITRRLNISKCS